MPKTVQRTAVFASLALICGLTAEIALEGHTLIPEAQAVIGRPMTPISYAGVARRTTRRAIYATSVYVASLPRGCTTVIIEGATLHRCGATYYQASGSRYVVVKVD